jgi:bifunctional non-homologous end joining protein LigD
MRSTSCPRATTVKFDGYRALVLKNGERVQIRSRNGKDLTSTYPSDGASGRPSWPDQVVLDGASVDTQNRQLIDTSKPAIN